MSDREIVLDQLTRRAFLHHSVQGVGTLALASMMGRNAWAAAGPANMPFKQHFAARTKRVIHLCMAGGPSHLETFDYKPVLEKHDGEPMPESFTKGKPIAQLQGKKLKIMGPQHPFAKHGRSGIEVSSILPETARIVDDLCVIKSVHTDQINHDPAHTLFNTGTPVPGRPSMGSWVTYGLGAETDELPGFVVLTSEGGGQSQPIAARQWHSGFLPSRYQGVKLNAVGDPVYYVSSPPGVTRQRQMDVFHAIRDLNEHASTRLDDPEISTRIAQYELAARMQLSVPELADTSDEPQHILDMYGGRPGDGSFASNCLMARRLAERGVRFIQLYHRGWDHHGAVKKGTEKTAALVDKAQAALITDLKQRGMLDDTLIIWGGEFGRTPMAQGSGRDHHIQGYTMFLTGGGIRGGQVYGATDEMGYNAVENKVHVRDIHATMLELMGIDHTRFKYKFQGLDVGLTGVEEAHTLRNLYA